MAGVVGESPITKGFQIGPCLFAIDDGDPYLVALGEVRKPLAVGTIERARDVFVLRTLRLFIHE